jgi:hypothetical protein
LKRLARIVAKALIRAVNDPTQTARNGGRKGNLRTVPDTAHAAPIGQAGMGRIFTERGQN